MIEINGGGLTLEQVARIARLFEPVRISPSAMAAIERSRAIVDEKSRSGAVVYGVTTGFGKFAEKRIADGDTEQLQHNLIVSHACGTGDPLPTDAVRAAMLLRLNALSSGYSGIRLSTMETLLAMLNLGVHPVIPEKGSLGASGDLVPLAHMVLPMIGEGKAEYKGETLSGAEAMRRAGLEPIRLAAKEGLALINGTQIMTAIGALAVTTRCGSKKPRYRRRTDLRSANLHHRRVRRAGAPPARASRAGCLRGESAQAAFWQRTIQRSGRRQGAGRIFHPLYSTDSRRKPGRDFLRAGRGDPRDQFGDRQPSDLSGRGRRALRRKLPRPAHALAFDFSRHPRSRTGERFRATHGAAGQSLPQQQPARVSSPNGG